MITIFPEYLGRVFFYVGPSAGAQQGHEEDTRERHHRSERRHHQA